PLADGLRLSRLLLRQELAKHPDAVPLVVAVTDGEATVPLRRGGNAVADALAEGARLRRAGILLVVADASRAGGGLNADLARAGGGISIPVAELAPEAIVDLVQGVERR
ncbi:MAG: magnesium chelatase, partial [Chloroflexota bacterium]